MPRSLVIELTEESALSPIVEKIDLISEQGQIRPYAPRDSNTCSQCVACSPKLAGTLTELILLKIVLFIIASNRHISKTTRNNVVVKQTLIALHMKPEFLH